MTYEEAIKNIKEWRDFAERRGSYYGEEAIPTYNLSIEALKKQIPKKPMPIITDDNEVVCVICPNCQKIRVDYNYCPECGQAIDWSE